MSGHTPGPWVIKHEWNIFGADRNYPGNERLVAATGGHTNNTHWRQVEAENFANTALIAAAPDLLAVLRETRSYVELGHGSDRYQVLDAIRAAITKAEGK